MQVVTAKHVAENRRTISSLITKRAGKRFSFRKMACMHIEFGSKNRQMAIGERAVSESDEKERTGVRDGTANSAK